MSNSAGEQDGCLAAHISQDSGMEKAKRGAANEDGCNQSDQNKSQPTPKPDAHSSESSSKTSPSNQETPTTTPSSCCDQESRSQIQDHMKNCDRDAEQRTNDKSSSAEVNGASLEGQSLSSPSNDLDADDRQQFKLPIAKDASTASSQGSTHDCTSQPKPLVVTKHHSVIEMPTTQSSSPEIKPRVPKRKTSVFSHSGFMGIHKLDQATIQQHPIVANCSTDKQDVQTNDHQMENKSQQHHHQQQSTSPRRSNRSDTLGSTGSSRASSCDEPTIVSPTKLFSPSLMQTLHHHQPQKAHDLKQTTSTNLNSKSSSHELPFANERQPEGGTNSTKTTDNNDFPAGRERDKLATTRDDSSNDEDEEEREVGDEEDDDSDDDVVFMAHKNLTADKDSSNLNLPPPFESIKAQLKRNSIPNAQDITRHIENLISRNEKIMENWNQVSIRSYNTSSQSTAAGTSNRRPSKRWSTTSIGKTIPSMESKCSYQPTRRLQPFQMANKQQVPVDHETASAQQSSQSSSCFKYELMPTTHVSLSVPTSPRQSTNPILDTKNFSQDKFNGCELTQNQGLRQSSVLNFNGHRPSLSIENAISNLSLKKHDDDQMQIHPQHQDPLDQFKQRDDIVMAAIMVERQRQQQLLEEYLRNGARQSTTTDDQHFHPDQILNHFQQQIQQQQQLQQQQQQHQQLIEQQLALSRLAAIENEYQQQQQKQHVAASLMAASLRNQQQNQQQLSASSQQLLHQFNCLTANQALENQLLNEYISKMVLSRDEIYKSQSREMASNNRDVIQHQQSKQPSPTSPSRLYLGHGTEMLTQSLDSATPTHRCEACDISFWTRDLLNYHNMTSCIARRGPGPAKPIAFNFNHPNGFDAAAPSNQLQHNMINNSSLQSPAVIVSHAPDTHSGPYICHTVNEHLQSKSASPTRRRTYNELDTPSSQEISSHMRQPKRQSTSSMFDQHQQNYDFQRKPFAFGKGGGEKLVPPRSPHSAHEPVDFAMQKKLDSTFSSILNQHKQHTTTITGEESNLPIKKRKISEPNMR